MSSPKRSTASPSPRQHPSAYDRPRVVASNGFQKIARPSVDVGYSSYQSGDPATSWRSSSSAPRQTPVSSSATDLLEKQPRSAIGYEWNERNGARSQGNDGTGTLSVEPDGEGYLGFASGSTLLRILQLCAGGLSLNHIPLDESQRASENVLGSGWQPSEADAASYIDAYFSHYHNQYPLLHEPTFRAQWCDVLPQPPRAQ